MASSMNTSAYGSVYSGHSDVDSWDRAHAIPNAVAPTLSVMSQESSSVLAIRAAFGVLV